VTVRVFGIRHHGPGSARALARSFEAWDPDAVLIEGPPEANPVLPLAASPAMRPPVALLAYMPSRPGASAFYPFASWSPEWIALGHALARAVPVSMIDLPAASYLTRTPWRSNGSGPSGRDGEDPGAAGERGGGDGRGGEGDEGPGGPGEPGEADGGGPELGAPLRQDPFARLAEAAGYDDPERWWEDTIEHRGDEEPWEALTEVIAELRADDPTPAGFDPVYEARREASMRQHIRAAEKVYQRVAVVCGAWHAPALTERGPARADAALLAGLTRERAAVTWTPWTSTRLSLASGYGAGVRSPGWYGHLFASPDRPVDRWMVKAATLLRAEQLDAAPASVIEAVRLADALASLRGRPLAGLSECTDAVRAVLTAGDDTAMALIDRRLVVGEDIGEVPPETPTVALAADLAAQQRRLRLKPEPAGRVLELDLRKETDRARSRLLHRLDLLGVPWGVVDDDIRGTGTFREQWTLVWAPELAVRVIEASAYGTTVEAAATARTVEQAAAATTVGAVTDLVERCLLADLPGAVGATMKALDDQAAATADAAELMDAVPALARVLRYGTVRRTDVEALDHVVRGLVARICVSLIPACASLDDESAAAMTERISNISAALGTLDDRPLREEWLDALGRLSVQPSLHGLVAGRSSRILLDAGRIPPEGVAPRLAAALSRGEDPSRAAAWVEGLVAGSGLLLVHDPALLAVIDQWLASVATGVFDDVLPLLRRAVSGFQPGERRLIGQAAQRLDGRGADLGGGRLSAVERDTGGDVDGARAAAIVPLLRVLLVPITDGKASDG
jgi:hypothetical protein